MPLILILLKGELESVVGMAMFWVMKDTCFDGSLIEEFVSVKSTIKIEGFAIPDSGTIIIVDFDVIWRFNFGVERTIFG